MAGFGGAESGFWVEGWRVLGTDGADSERSGGSLGLIDDSEGGTWDWEVLVLPIPEHRLNKKADTEHEILGLGRLLWFG